MATPNLSPPPDDLRRDLAEQRLAEHVRMVVADAPPLSEGQLDQLAAVFNVRHRLGDVEALNQSSTPAHARPGGCVTTDGRTRRRIQRPAGSSTG